MVPTDKTVPVQPTRITRLLEDVLGCKWSWSILRAIHAGTHRPGQIERAISGLSTKVLNERLRKLVRHGVLKKRSSRKSRRMSSMDSRNLAKSFWRCCGKSRCLNVNVPNRSLHGTVLLSLRGVNHAGELGRRIQQAMRSSLCSSRVRSNRSFTRSAHGRPMISSVIRVTRPPDEWCCGFCPRSLIEELGA